MADNKDAIRIAPSVLAADFSRLAEEIDRVTEAGADLLHLDVMDGHFVPNLTIGPAVVEAIREKTALPFDIHLMISPVDPFIEAFATAGADIITAHIEAGPHAHRTLQHIKSLGVKAGISLNPSTPASSIRHILDTVDLILIMTVNPGFGGQSFIKEQLGKIRTIRKMIDETGRDIDLEVDGGINEKTARHAISAGADVLVAGTAVFGEGASKYADKISQLRGR